MSGHGRVTQDSQLIFLFLAGNRYVATLRVHPDYKLAQWSLHSHAVLKPHMSASRLTAVTHLLLHSTARSTSRNPNTTPPETVAQNHRDCSLGSLRQLPQVAEHIIKPPLDTPWVPHGRLLPLRSTAAPDAALPRHIEILVALPAAAKSCNASKLTSLARASCRKLAHAFATGSSRYTSAPFSLKSSLISAMPRCAAAFASSWCSAAYSRSSCEICMLQNLGPHMLQKCAVFAGSCTACELEHMHVDSRSKWTADAGNGQLCPQAMTMSHDCYAATNYMTLSHLQELLN